MDNNWLPDEQILALMPWLTEIEPIGEPEPHGGLQMQAAGVGTDPSHVTSEEPVSTPMQEDISHYQLDAHSSLEHHAYLNATSSQHSITTGESDVLFACTVPDCTRSYGRKSELDRHIREKHKNESGRFLCPVDLCPRSIEGEGFERMCHLTAHLTTKQEGHKMDKTRAKYEARKANPQKNGAKKE